MPAGAVKAVVTAHVWMTQANRTAVLRARTQIFACFTEILT